MDGGVQSHEVDADFGEFLCQALLNLLRAGDFPKVASVGKFSSRIRTNLLQRLQYLNTALVENCDVTVAVNFGSVCLIETIDSDLPSASNG